MQVLKRRKQIKGICYLLSTIQLGWQEIIIFSENPMHSDREGIISLSEYVKVYISTPETEYTAYGKQCSFLLFLFFFVITSNLPTNKGAFKPYHCFLTLV